MSVIIENYSAIANLHRELFAQGMEISLTEEDRATLGVDAESVYFKGTDVFVNGKKVGFVGLNVDQNVTTHGVAMNVCNDLRPFRHIVPCGQMNRSLVSLRELLNGGGVSIYDVYWRFMTCFEHLTGAEMEEVSALTIY